MRYRIVIDQPQPFGKPVSTVLRTTGCWADAVVATAATSPLIARVLGIGQDTVTGKLALCGY